MHIRLERDMLREEDASIELLTTNQPLALSNK
ncbi:MAG: hypothetical protein KatS3mg003_1290 [Candidatus Nitrosocaldaceae archaeon]|nr:MAG: hypothetical protein KatS3mg003_1290 [Candidatus Nitrosocaldaceae archaeon]